MKISTIMIRTLVIIFSLGATMVCASPTINIDGNMSLEEWGTYFVDDEEVTQDGTHVFVGPGYGGQDFDIEKLGLYIDDEYLYLGLQTGFELNHRENSEYPGDIAIGFNFDEDAPFSVDNYELAFKFNFGFNQGGDKSGFQGEDTFHINIDDLNRADLEIYTVDTNADQPWNTRQFDPDDPEGPYPYTVNAGTSLGFVEGDGMGSVAYNRYDETGTPYSSSNSDPYYNTIEAAVRLDSISTELSQIGINSISNASIFWTMSCNNDMVEYHNSFTQTPEPATFLLFGAGLLGGVGVLGRKRKKGHDETSA